MRDRLGNVPDNVIRLTLVLILLILSVASLVGGAQANLHDGARASGCFEETLQAAQRTDRGE